MYNSENNCHGFIMRRKCIDVNIPLITNIKCARLFVASLREITLKMELIINLGMNM